MTAAVTEQAEPWPDSVPIARHFCFLTSRHTRVPRQRHAYFGSGLSKALRPTEGPTSLALFNSWGPCGHLGGGLLYHSWLPVGPLGACVAATAAVSICWIAASCSDTLSLADVLMYPHVSPTTLLLMCPAAGGSGVLRSSLARRLVRGSQRTDVAGRGLFAKQMVEAAPSCSQILRVPSSTKGMNCRRVWFNSARAHLAIDCLGWLDVWCVIV